MNSPTDKTAQLSVRLPGRGQAGEKAARSKSRAGERERTGKRNGWVKVGLRVLVPAIILLFWWALSMDQKIGLYVVSPVAAFRAFFTDFFTVDPSSAFLAPATYENVFPSVGRALAGFGIAVAVGVGVGLLISLFRVLRGLFLPLVHLGRSLPIPALLGVFFFLFGIGDWPKIFLIFFSIVWPILLNTIDGVASIGAVQKHVAAVFRIPDRDVLLHIVLPGASPKIFAGMRTSLALSLILMIISELQKSDNGLGYMLIQSQRHFDYANFWAVLLMLVLLGMLFNIAFLAIERRVLAWHRGVTDKHE